VKHHASLVITGTRPVMTREANVQPIRDIGMGLFS
jgi:hypothetical protein